jgi:hypothetical protein
MLAECAEIAFRLHHYTEFDGLAIELLWLIAPGLRGRFEHVLRIGSDPQEESKWMVGSSEWKAGAQP